MTGAPGSTTRPTTRQVLVFTGVVCALVGIGVAAGAVGGHAGDRATTAAALPAGTGTCDAAQVARHVLPSMVTIRVGSASGEGSGSGEVIDASGIVLTNDHVIAAADGDTVSLELDDGTELSATIIGRDPRTDLAVLRADTDRALTPLGWGDSDDLVVGEPVVALGAPLGLTGTVTTGIVSALGRSVPVPTGDGSGTTVLTGAVQTDAAINPGNSGGALVDCRGRLVGINTAIATVPSASGVSSGSVGIGFAVPAAVARPIAAALRADGRVAHPTLGVRTVPVVVRHRDDTTAVGLQLTAVADDGPAAAAGLRPGDVVTAIGGVDTLHPDTVAHLEATRDAGDDLRVTVVRDGDEHVVTATLVAAATS
ncbi:trypsin-like peptidase domain-containing protein [Curtobacterium sp. PhB136]|uniref:S1C family serine protease n=1 Tax=Curtobacterium sp. PhB136 TaxID=2485181 RepID=UPI00104F5329|nr:trypsin-like peptidase domain-containing protein [Curtobacterium sp. PhB136]TCK63721.1 putative serine protease PepD [Curtobacterium sp. PhB136]